MNKIDYKELASKIFCFAALGILILIAFKYLFGYVLPFLIAFGVGYIVHPFAMEVSVKTKISRKVCAFVLVFCFLTILFSLLFILGNKLLYEMQNLLNSLNSNSEAIAEYIERVIGYLNSIGEKLPIINKLQNTELSELLKDNVNKLISSIWESFLSTLGTAIPNIATGIVMSLPDLLLTVLISLISCFYFAMDMNVFRLKVKDVLPERVVNVLSSVKKTVEIGFKKYIKAYALIFLITFVELLLGFWIIGIDYSFVLAIFVAFVDFLPLLGTAAILLPWGIVLLLMKDVFRGIGILLLMIVTTVVRQIVEPKILGDSFGVHPLITLIAIYIGYRVWGFWGLLLAPLATLILLSKKRTE
jgi:sporulation integral membrane protein YtvI